MPNPLHLSLFSGIGGLDLAAEMAGFETVGQCENAKYPTKVLEKHWPDVPRWEDIRTLTKESFYERTGLHTVDLISGGFPCQPFSVAGKQKGKGDERYLWPEMLRVIHEIAPCWVVGENVPGILRIAAADVISDLEREGYHTVLFDFEAAAVGAPHRRERIAFVAHRNGEGLQRRQRECLQKYSSQRASWESDTYPELGIVENANSSRCSKQTILREQSGRTKSVSPGQMQQDRNAGGTWGWQSQPGVGGMANGLSDWLDRGMSAPGKWLKDPYPAIPRVEIGIKNRANRIKCLGNAVVPQQFFPIFAAIRKELDHAEAESVA